jgi:hypothetical protein
MEIPESVIERATFFAIRYSNMNNEEEIRNYVRKMLEQKNYVRKMLEQKVLGIQCFGGEVVWKE